MSSNAYITGVATTWLMFLLGVLSVGDAGTHGKSITKKHEPRSGDTGL